MVLWTDWEVIFRVWGHWLGLWIVCYGGKERLRFPRLSCSCGQRLKRKSPGVPHAVSSPCGLLRGALCALSEWPQGLSAAWFQGRQAQTARFLTGVRGSPLLHFIGQASHCGQLRCNEREVRLYCWCKEQHIHTGREKTKGNHLADYLVNTIVVN